MASFAVSDTARNFSSLARRASSACRRSVMSRLTPKVPITSPFKSRMIILVVETDRRLSGAAGPLNFVDHRFPRTQDGLLILESLLSMLWGEIVKIGFPQCLGRIF